MGIGAWMRAVRSWVLGPSRLPPIASGFSPEDARGHPRVLKRGIYAWYADRHTQDLMRRARLPVRRRGLVYVGKTKGPFAKRVLGEHVDGCGRNSALLKTLRGLLVDAGLPAGRAEVKGFAHEHLRVQILPVRRRRIDSAERDFIEKHKPSFNQVGNPDRANVQRIKELQALGALGGSGAIRRLRSLGRSLAGVGRGRN